MADDIVARLRNLAADGLGGCCADMSDAADEIEQLRNYTDTGVVESSGINDDMVTRLRDKIPYGLTDYTLLADAANLIQGLDREIMRRDGIIIELRAEIQRLEQVTRD